MITPQNYSAYSTSFTQRRKKVRRKKRRKTLNIKCTFKGLFDPPNISTGQNST
jgi:hypothetical protein